MKRSIDTYPNTSFRFRFIFFFRSNFNCDMCGWAAATQYTCSAYTMRRVCDEFVLEGQSIHLIDMFAYTFFPFRLVDDDATQFYFLTTCRLVVTSFRLELRNRLSRSNAHIHSYVIGTLMIHITMHYNCLYMFTQPSWLCLFVVCWYVASITRDTNGSSETKFIEDVCLGIIMQINLESFKNPFRRLICPVLFSSF